MSAIPSGVGRRWSRRRFLTASGAGLVGLVAGCSGDGPGDGAAGAPGDGTASGFPMRVAGAKGTVELAAPPQRVVCVGYLRDTDIALGLGVMPVGVQRTSLFPDGVAPWVQPQLGPTGPELLDDRSTDFEHIAALRPDLILATDSYRLDADYPRLSQIAPTLSYRTGIGSETWQDMTTFAGPALGRGPEADHVVAAVEQLLVNAREQHGELAGKTFTFGPVQPDGTIYTINSTEDAAAGLLTQLGLTLSPTVTGLPGTGIANRAQIPAERLALLDADLLLLTFTGDGSRRRLEANPLFQQLPAVRRGSYVPLGSGPALALGFPSVLSIPYALDQTLPALTAAVRT